jgi:Sec23-binding domain of Sec16
MAGSGACRVFAAQSAAVPALTWMKRAQVWPLAMLIANSMGPEQLQATLRSMSTRVLSRDSALQTFAHISTRDFDTAAVVLASRPPGNVPGLLGAGGPGLGAPPAGVNHTQQPAFGAQPAGAMAMHQAAGVAAHAEPSETSPTPQQAPAWPRQLLMLAAHRCAGDAVALGALGDRLWDSASDDEDRAYAHVCYVLAGRLPDAAGDTNSRFAMPGLVSSAPVVTPDVETLQRSELLASCMAQASGVAMYGVAPAYVLVRISPWSSHLLGSLTAPPPPPPLSAVAFHVRAGMLDPCLAGSQSADWPLRQILVSESWPSLGHVSVTGGECCHMRWWCVHSHGLVLA